MLLPFITPANAIVNGVNIFGGCIVYGIDLERICDDKGPHFQLNQKLKEKEALHDIELYTDFVLPLSPMQGVVLFVTTQQYQVVWKDRNGIYWSFVGCTTNNIVESDVHAKMINKIEQDLARKCGHT